MSMKKFKDKKNGFIVVVIVTFCIQFSKIAPKIAPRKIKLKKIGFVVVVIVVIVVK